MQWAHLVLIRLSAAKVRVKTRGVVASRGRLKSSDTGLNSTEVPGNGSWLHRTRRGFSLLQPAKMHMSTVNNRLGRPKAQERAVRLCRDLEILHPQLPLAEEVPLSPIDSHLRSNPTQTHCLPHLTVADDLIQVPKLPVKGTPQRVATRREFKGKSGRNDIGRMPFGCEPGKPWRNGHALGYTVLYSSPLAITMKPIRGF